MTQSCQYVQTTVGCLYEFISMLFLYNSYTISFINIFIIIKFLFLYF